MKTVRLPLSKVKKPERNIRIHTEKQIQEFGRSVEMFGQIRPIVIDEGNVILAGVGLYETLLSLGRAEGDFYRAVGLSENQKKKLMIADNKIFGLGIDNLDVFNAFLDELGRDLDIPGYDEDILRSMVAAADEVSQKIGEYGTVDAEGLNSIKAGASRKEELLSAAQTEAPIEPTAEPPAEGDGNKIHIICPHCKGEIWL